MVSPMRHGTALGAAAAAVLLQSALLAAGTSGGRFSVNPTLVVFSRQTTSVLVSLANESPDEMRFQLSAFAWDQAPDGEMRLAPTEDIVFFPQMLVLAPGESRNVRVGTLAGPDASERSYRLFVEQLPPSEAVRKPGVVQVLTRVGIPIFVAPPAAVQSAELRGLSRERGSLSFTLANTGNVHLAPEEVTVRALARDGTVLGERTLSAWYVLAGGTRSFATDLPGLTSPQAAEVLVETRVGERVVSGRLDLATRVSR